ncbi:unnamed protein product [Prorocentrum cordatum]|uniref:Protein kinase domain-containing protein n=1 Tax=Prorocentrum cordatum TaxID=2364126 RepID=A0ABN9W0P4_9DINO|nr:unnamed protein product [Polarella glacialis]
MEHASRMIYMHRHPAARGQSRHPSAPCAGVEAQAEGTMLWACGIVLVRLLCAELPQDWVYRHGGLGSTEGLERELPPGHCLLRRGGGGCRDLLERIFSREATPTIAEVLMHDWVREARMAWNQSDAHAPEPPQAVQLALRAPPSAGADRWNAWIPLKDPLIGHARRGQAAPVGQGQGDHRPGSGVLGRPLPAGRLPGGGAGGRGGRRSGGQRPRVAVADPRSHGRRDRGSRTP